MQEKHSEDYIRKTYKDTIMCLLDNLNEHGILKAMQKILDLMENPIYQKEKK